MSRTSPVKSSTFARSPLAVGGLTRLQRSTTSILPNPPASGPERWTSLAPSISPSRWWRRTYNVLRDVPQAEIKKAFAEILGDPGVHTDLDGEQSTLWTTDVVIENRPLRAAVLFNGPTEVGPLTIASLGKRGERIDRLSETGADVLVMQHCHLVTAPVANMLRVYASDPRHQRRYLVINGYDTIKLLRHFGYIT